MAAHAAEPRRPKLCSEMMQARALTEGKTWPGTCSVSLMRGEQDNVHRKREESRALIALAQPGTDAPAERVRPLATFIAQMLACRARLPDFRLNRRAPPTAAAAHYGAAPTEPPPRRFERVL